MHVFGCRDFMRESGGFGVAFPVFGWPTVQELMTINQFLGTNPKRTGPNERLGPYTSTADDTRRGKPSLSDTQTRVI